MHIVENIHATSGKRSRQISSDRKCEKQNNMPRLQESREAIFVMKTISFAKPLMKEIGLMNGAFHGSAQYTSCQEWRWDFVPNIAIRWLLPPSHQIIWKMLYNWMPGKNRRQNEMQKLENSSSLSEYFKKLSATSQHCAYACCILLNSFQWRIYV